MREGSRFRALKALNPIAQGKRAARHPGLRVKKEIQSLERGDIIKPAMRFAVIVEKGETSFGAYVPDLPGCIAAADTREEVLQLIHEAIEFHVEGLREDGQPIPEPSSSIEYVEVAA